MADSGMREAEPHSDKLPPVEEALRQARVEQVIMVGDQAGAATPQHLEKIALYNTLYGAAFVLVGILAIVCPVTFTLAIDLFIGALLLVGGVVALLSFCMLAGSPGSLLFLLLGVIHLAIGGWLLMSPSIGIVYLTLVLCGWFISQGVCKMAMAYSMRGVSSWPAVFASGVLSIVLGFWILAILPDSALWVLGVLFGVDLLVTGVASLLVALMACLGKRVGENQVPLLPAETTTVTTISNV
eukprot:jgi/Mesen1/8442/ME000475S07697